MTMYFIINEKLSLVSYLKIDNFKVGSSIKLTYIDYTWNKEWKWNICIFQDKKQKI